MVPTCCSKEDPLLKLFWISISFRGVCPVQRTHWFLCWYGCFRWFEQVALLNNFEWLKQGDPTKKTCSQHLPTVFVQQFHSQDECQMWMFWVFWICISQGFIQAASFPLGSTSLHVEPHHHHKKGVNLSSKPPCHIFQLFQTKLIALHLHTVGKQRSKWTSKFHLHTGTSDLIFICFYCPLYNPPELPLFLLTHPEFPEITERGLLPSGLDMTNYWLGE